MYHTPLLYINCVPDRLVTVRDVAPPGRYIGHPPPPASSLLYTVFAANVVLIIVIISPSDAVAHSMLRSVMADVLVSCTNGVGCASAEMLVSELVVMDKTSRVDPNAVGARVGAPVGASVGASTHAHMYTPMMESHPVAPLSITFVPATLLIPYDPVTPELVEVHSEHLAVPPWLPVQ